ncbi:MAG: hypothetical protein PUC65_08330 [Clostridiales bacterium]|nr:hypothetical protein [Clostridiales bacterium]
MIKVAHAVYDECGKSSGGKPGDQTGKEVAVWDWYKSGKTGWQAVFRPKDTKIAKKISQTALDITHNDCVGYNQYRRTTLYDRAKDVNYDISKIKTKCETDCSAMVAVCVLSAGINVSYSMCTSTEWSILERTGKFEILTDKKYLTSAKYLKDGDILWRHGHTAIAVDITTVKDLQVALNTFGYGLVEDGIRGKKTNDAIADLHKRIQSLDKMIASL